MSSGTDGRHLLLIHGAFHGAWCWDRLLPELAAQGVDASAVELPFTSVADDQATVESAIERIAGGGQQVVALGHSFGGAVISRSAHRAAHLIYLTAVMVEPGDATDLGESPGLAALSLEGDTASVSPEGAVTAFYHRCSPADAEWATARLRPMPMSVLIGATTDSPAFRSVPSTYVVCDDDQIISAAAQSTMAELAGRVEHIDSDHSPFLSYPADLARLLARVVSDA